MFIMILFHIMEPEKKVSDLPLLEIMIMIFKNLFKLSKNVVVIQVQGLTRSVGVRVGRGLVWWLRPVLSCFGTWADVTLTNEEP